MPRLAQIVPRQRAGESAGRPWCVDLSAKVVAQLGEEDGRRKKHYFASKAEADQFCRDTRARAASFDDASRHMTGEQRLEAYRAFLVCAAHGFTLADAVEEKRHRVLAQERSVLIPKLVEVVLADKQAKGKSETYQQDLKNRLNRFAKDHQEVKASQVTTESLEDWLTSLVVGPTTRNNYRRLLKLAFNYALRKEWVPRNVARHIEIAKEASGEVEALTADECAALLGAANEEALPVVAIGLFAGLRPFEIMRLDWSEIHWQEGGGEIDAPPAEDSDIEVKAAKAKTAQRRLVVIRPNLATFLKPYRERTGPVYQPGKWPWYRYLPTLRKAAGLTRWPADAFRHTFCSMDLAHFNDQNGLAKRMGHTDTDLIFTRYRRVVKASEAEKFWNLYPTAK